MVRKAHACAVSYQVRARCFQKMLRSALLLVTTLLGLWRGGVQGYSDGPPLDRFPELCASMTPGLKAHRSGPSNSTFPFEVSFAQTCFEAGGQVEGECRKGRAFLGNDSCWENVVVVRLCLIIVRGKGVPFACRLTFDSFVQIWQENIFLGVMRFGV